MNRRSFLKDSIGALLFAGLSSNKALAQIVETLTPESPKVLLYLIQTNSGEWKIRATKWIDLYKVKRLKKCFVKQETFKALDIVNYEDATNRKYELWHQYNCTGRLTPVKIIQDTNAGKKCLKSEKYLEYIKSDKFKENKKKWASGAGKLRGKILGEENKKKGVDFKALSLLGVEKWKQITETMSDEEKKIISDKISKSQLGKKHTEETKKKISEKAKGRPSPNKGKKFSEEVRKNMSKGQMGRKHTEEYKLNLKKRMLENNPFKGKKHTEEAKNIIKQKHPSKIKGSCMHCKKTFDLANLNRYHGDRCKSKDIKKANEEFLLSDRSMKIINLVEQGYTNREITELTGHCKNTILRTKRTYKSVFC